MGEHMNIYDLQSTIRDRLYQRQMQAACYGISADPSITTESKDLAELKRWIDRTVQIHSERGYTKQLEQTVIKKARTLNIFIDTLEYD